MKNYNIIESTEELNTILEVIRRWHNNGGDISAFYVPYDPDDDEADEQYGTYYFMISKYANKDEALALFFNDMKGYTYSKLKYIRAFRDQNGELLYKTELSAELALENYIEESVREEFR